MNNEVTYQKEIWEENYPALTELKNRIEKKERNLWERSAYQDDFLDMRIGIGKRELDAEVDYQAKTFSLDEDDLLEKMYALGEEKKYLTNVPITTSFYKNTSSGIIGKKEALEKIANNLILEFASLYSYDEIKLVFVHQENEFNYVKWLPHTFSKDMKTRYIATNPKELKELSFSLQTIMNTRLEEGNNEKLPYYVIFILDEKLGQKTRSIK